MTAKSCACIPSRTTNSRGWNVEQQQEPIGMTVINAEPYPCKCQAVTAMDAMPDPDSRLRVYEALS